MVVLTVVRHGETKMNKADIVQSRTPGELSEDGVKMAESLGQHLKDLKFSHVFTSDLKRCHDTTLNILKHSNHYPVPEPVLKPILRERDFGDLEFQPNHTVRELREKHGLPDHIVPVPGGEDYENVKKRCAEFFEIICKLADELEEEEHILVVSHGCWILCFLDFLMDNLDSIELYNYEHEQRPMMNTAQTKIHIGKLSSEGNNNIKIKRSLKFAHVHCTKHLEWMKK